MRIYTILASVLLFYSIKVGAETRYEAEYLGCYRDGRRRSLTGPQKNFGKSATVDVCTNWCFTRGPGYKLAGLQNGNECWCGDNYESYIWNNRDDPVGGCTMACQGNASQTCGGSYRNSLYKRVTATTSTTTTATTTTTTARTTTSTTTTTTTTTTSTTISTPTATTTTIQRRTNSSITPAYNMTSFNPSSLTNQSDGANKAQENSQEIGIYVYVGGGVAAFVIVIIIVIVMVIVIRKRNNSKPQATKSVHKDLHSNPSCAQNRFGDEQSSQIITAGYSCVQSDEMMPDEQNDQAGAACATAYVNVRMEEPSTAVYCNTVVTGEAMVHNTAPATDLNSPPDVYATVNKTPAAAHEGSNTDPLYSLAEPIEDDMVVVENDLYGT